MRYKDQQYMTEIAGRISGAVKYHRLLSHAKACFRPEPTRLSKAFREAGATGDDEVMEHPYGKIYERIGENWVLLYDVAEDPSAPYISKAVRLVPYKESIHYDTFQTQWIQESRPWVLNNAS